MATFSNVTPAERSASGSQSVINNPDDLWLVQIKGTLPDSVSTSTGFVFRQVSSFSEAENPAADLMSAFFTEVNNPWDKLILVLSDKFTAACVTISNLSVPKSFTNTFTIQAGSGGVLLSEVNSSQSIHRIRYMDVDGNLKARRSIYIPGIANSFISDSKITGAGVTLLTDFINSLYTINGPIGEWQWSYTSDPEKPQSDAANGHPAIFTGRLKSRRPSLC